MFTIPLKKYSNPVFKYGFVKLIDCMPRIIPENGKKLMCDTAVVQAARVSYGQELKDFETDKKLINYLYKHKHTSPFEMVKFKFHIKAPIFVARQWFRHRTANYNEISGRYTELPNEIYKPDKVSSQSKENKQLSANDNLLSNLKVKNLHESANLYNILQYRAYEELLKEGVSREIARINLPLSLYTEFYYCTDLHNLLNFLKLRNAPNAQKEIREYAQKIEDIIKPLCPITFEAYSNNKTITLSQNQLNSLRLVNNTNLTKRELNELTSYLNIVN